MTAKNSWWRCVDEQIGQATPNQQLNLLQLIVSVLKNDDKAALPRSAST